MDERQFKELMAGIDVLIRLLALNFVKDIKAQKRQITTLHSFGFGPSKIADILDTTPNTVNVALSRYRKRRQKKGTEEKATEDENARN